jgi:hypothetical protein
MLERTQEDALALLGALKPSARPVVAIVPRKRRPLTTTDPPRGRHARSMAAADALGHGMRELELLDLGRVP